MLHRLCLHPDDRACQHFVTGSLLSLCARRRRSGAHFLRLHHCCYCVLLRAPRRAKWIESQALLVQRCTTSLLLFFYLRWGVHANMRVPPSASGNLNFVRVPRQLEARRALQARR